MFTKAIALSWILGALVAIPANAVERPRIRDEDMATAIYQCGVAGEKQNAQNRAEKQELNESVFTALRSAILIPNKPPVPVFQFKATTGPTVPSLVIDIRRSPSDDSAGTEIPTIPAACVGQDYQVDAGGKITFIGKNGVPTKPVFWFSLDGLKHTRWYQPSEEPPIDDALWLIRSADTVTAHAGPNDWPSGCRYAHSGISVLPVSPPTNPPTPSNVMQFTLACGTGSYYYSLHLQQSVADPNDPSVSYTVDLIMDPLLINHQ
jgi:hypothetical protein